MAALNVRELPQAEQLAQIVQNLINTDGEPPIGFVIVLAIPPEGDEPAGYNFTTNLGNGNAKELLKFIVENEADEEAVQDSSEES